MRAITPVWKRVLLAGTVSAIAGWPAVSLVWSAEKSQQGPSNQPSANAAAEKSQPEKEQLNKAVEDAQEAEQREAKEIEHRIKTDPLWQPSHQETAVIHPTDRSKPLALNSFCVNIDGNLLAACGGDREEYVQAAKPGEYYVRKISEPAEIRVLSPEGKRLKTWPMAFRPDALCVTADGTIYLGGDGRLAKLDQAGKVLATAASPAVVSQAPTTKDKAVAAADGKQPAADEETTSTAAALAERTKRITGIAVTKRDVFLCCPIQKIWTYAVWRTDHDFGQPQKIVEGLIGCCGQMDIQAHDGDLWVAHSYRHRVDHYDRDGNELLTFGRHDRRAADGFSGCCEPKNLRFGPRGELYTAESIPVVAVKRFTTAGKFLGVVGIPEFNAGCGRTTIDMSPDGSQVYVLDRSTNSIHVLSKK